MRTILLIGAGKSTSYLIEYFLEKAEKENLFLRIGDLNPTHANKLLQNHPRAEAFELNIQNDQARKEAVASCDIVVSMLPATMHNAVAKDCIAYIKIWLLNPM